MTETPARVGRYQIVRLIAHGGMGSLYLARDPALDRLIAIKLLKHGFEDEGLRDRFTREARATGGLRHPNIVTVFDVGEHEDRPFIAMEYVPGETLEQLIRQGAAIPLAEKLANLEDLCAGLHSAHSAGIIHRDIKPANVMIDIHGTLKILDFGIARVGETGTTQAGDVVGTLNYMAPEQLVGRRLDHRVDVYAVGVVAYEWLSFQRAFPGTIQDGILFRILHTSPDPLENLLPDLDPEVARIVQRALARDPDDRYQDTETLRADLAAVRTKLVEASPSETEAVAHDAETSLTPVGSARRARPQTGTERRPTTTGLSKRIETSARAPGLRPHARHVALATGAVVLVLVATGLWWRGATGPVPPPAESSGPVEPSQQPSAGTQDQAAAEGPRSGDRSPADQVESLRAAIRGHMAAGRPQEALDALGAGLLLDADDPELGALADDLERVARTRATQARQMAVQGGSGATASPAFRDGRAREREAASLEGSGDRVGAIRAWLAAAALFDTAGRFATRNPPPAARAPAPARDPVAEGAKPKAAAAAEPGTRVTSPGTDPLIALPGSPATPPPAAPGPEPAKPEPPKPAPADPPRDPRAVETAAVLRTLERYAEAYRSRDIRAVARVMPGFTSRQLRDLERDFSNYRSYDVEIRDFKVTIDAATATAVGTVARTFETTTGVQGGNQVVTVFHLRKTGGGWVIERLEAR